MPTRTLLIAEDDELLAKAYRLTFEPKGFTVTIARDGFETLRHIEAAKPDLLLLDLLMPEMNGIEVLEALQGRLDFPVIVFTNISKEASRARCLELGAREYLIKCTLSLEDLHRHVVRQLGT
jgi:DNA-binding response OmpR family regulator